MQRNTFKHWVYTPITAINSKWTTDLNIKYKITKILEDNIGENYDNKGPNCERNN